MLLQSIDERLKLADSIRPCVQRYNSGNYDEAQELVYIWAHLEVVMRRYLDELLPRVKNVTQPEQVCETEQDIRFALEEICSLIQMPKSYQSFIRPIEEPS